MSHKLDIKRFRFNGNMYHYIPVESIRSEEDMPLFHKSKYSKYQNVGMAFDIETTSFETPEGKHLATMYMWQFAIGDMTVIGRTWGDFLLFMEFLNQKAEKEDCELLILDQNFSFEFQFIKGWFHWNKRKDGNPDIFAKSDREILYARWKRCEFRDTLALTGMGLDRYAKNYGLPISKLSGELDYSLIRHSGTELQNNEIAYSINDVQVLRWFYEIYLYPEFLKKGKIIPLTSTGIVRQEMKELFDSLPKSEKAEYHRMIRNAFPPYILYMAMRQYLFRGGLTHANTSLCNALINERAASYDLKSAHPSSMLREKFPYKFYRVNKKLFNKVLEECREGEYTFIGSFIFKNIRAKGWHCIESKNKLVNYSPDAVFENGRLAFASEITVDLCSIDWENYEKMYTFDSVECEWLYEAEMKPLPDFLRKMVCKYFELKEVTENPIDRGNVKRKVNGLFGMCSTGLVEQEVIFDEVKNEFILSSDVKNYFELYRNLLLLPQWSIYIAAYTRRDIVDIIDMTGPDSVYYDTDSDKILNYEKYEDKIEEFNARRMEANMNMELYDFNPEHFRRIGCFELEYITDPDGLKVLGAKRYVVKHDGETHVTVAGMRKGSLEAYCEKNGLDVFETFKDGLRLDRTYSRKQTTSYTDHDFEYDLTDYLGDKTRIREKSAVAIYSIPFEMNVEKEFLNRIAIMREERQNQIWKGVL